MRVAMDIFSGLPNPEWELAPEQRRELLTRIADEKPTLASPSAAPAILGYRGFVVSSETISDESELRNYRLPREFRIVGSDFFDGNTATEHMLVNLAGLAEAAPSDVRAVAEQQIEAPSAAMTDELQSMASAGLTTAHFEGLAACAIFRTSSLTFSFWNDSPHRASNNCYNYASNWRTGTFAQPGRGTGRVFSQLTASDIFAAAGRDGYRMTCSGTNLQVALAIWPNRDYHWWRRTANVNGAVRWCHKPGGTAARNTDNSGRAITSPYTCDRGPYTSWGGYRFGPGSSRTTVR